MANTLQSMGCKAQMQQTILEIMRGRNKEALLDFIESSGKCRKVFKSSVRRLHFSAEDIEWTFHTIYENATRKRHLKLALHVACTTCNNNACDSHRNILAEFCCSCPNDFNIKKKVYMCSLKELYRHSHNVPQEAKIEPSFLQCVRTLCDPQKCRRWKDNQKILFNFAVRMQNIVLMSASCGVGVGKQELKFAKDVLIAMVARFGEDTELLVSSLARMTDVVAHCLQAWFKGFVAKVLMSAVIKSRGQCSYSRFVVFPESSLKDWYNGKTVQILHILIENEAWDVIGYMLNSTWPIGTDFPFRIETQILDLCLEKMVANKNVWQKCAIILDCSIEKYRFRLDNLPDKLQHLRKYGQGDQQAILESLSKWCVENSFPRLALLLALVLNDFSLVKNVMSTRDFVIPACFWEGALLYSMEMGHYDVATEFLSCRSKEAFLTYSDMVTFDKNLTHLLSDHAGHIGSLVRACLERAKYDTSLFDWALCLSVLDETGDFSLFEEVAMCESNFKQVVLDYVFNKLFDSRYTRVMKLFLTRFSSKISRNYFRGALTEVVRYNRVQLATVLFEFTDVPSLTADGYDWAIGQLFIFSVQEDGGLMRLCVVSGLASEYRWIKGRILFDNCPLLSACHEIAMFDKEKYFDIVKLLLNSGAYTHSMLVKVVSSQRYKRLLLERDQMAEAHEFILNAMTAPSRLEHQARLAVSHAIGCCQGRKERIEALGMSQPVKDLLNFKDVV